MESIQHEEEENVSEKLAEIKGDAIGDTLYSERWVLRVLIKLSEISDETWNSDFEQDLCLLWDMTTEKDVVQFLLTNDFLDLFCKTVRVVNNARCLEIVVGILGNICCLDTGKIALAQHNASLAVINLITSDDSLILIQVIRLINSCLFSYRIEESPCDTRPTSPTNVSPVPTAENIETKCEVDDSSPTSWLQIITPHKEFLVRHLGFFLSSAINGDLLCSSLELLDSLLAIPSLHLSSAVSSSLELATGLPECLLQLLKTAKVGDSATSNRKLWRSLQVWMTLVGSVASTHEGRINLASSGDVLTKCFTKLVVVLTTPDALKTQEPEMAILCLCVLETLPDLKVSTPVLCRLTKVLYDLDKGIVELSKNSEDHLDVFNLLHRGSQYLKQRVEKSDDLISILQNLNEDCINFLVSISSDDENLINCIERGLLQIRTNGLVQ